MKRVITKPSRVFSKLKVTVVVSSCGPELVMSHVDVTTLVSNSPTLVGDAVGVVPDVFSTAP